MSSMGVYQVGEIPFDLVYEFVDAAGSPIDITGWSATSTVRAPDGTVTTPSVSVIDGAAGQVGRPWTASMTDQAGVYRSSITVTNGTYTLTSNGLTWVVETHP